MRFARAVPLRVDLDFRPNRSRVGGAGWLMLGIGLAAFTVAALHWSEVEADLAEREQIVARLREVVQTSPAIAVATTRRAPGREEWRAAQDVASSLDAGWGRLLASLASAQSTKVTWLTLDADPARSRLRLVGEAASMEAMLDFVARLVEADELRDVRLVSYERASTEATEVLRFEVGGSWGAAR